MERRRASTKELQGHSHPLVRRPEGEKSTRDAITGGEACGCPLGPGIDQAAYIQGKYVSFRN